MKDDEKGKVIQFPQPKQLLNWLRTLPPGGELRIIFKDEVLKKDDKQEEGE